MPLEDPAHPLPAAAALAVAALLAPAVAAAARSPRCPTGPASRNWSYAGESTLAAGLTYQGTVVGGLSSITYDSEREVYYALSDSPTSTRDRSGSTR